MKRRVTIHLPRDCEDEIKRGGVLPFFLPLPEIFGWQVGLDFTGSGWIRLYLCGGDLDLGGYEIEDWVLTFRTSDVHKQAWKTIEFEEGTVAIRLAWSGDDAHEIPRPVVEDLLGKELSIGEKAEILSEFLQRWEALAKNMRIGVRAGRQTGFDLLLRELPTEERQRLAAVVSEISQHAQTQRARQREQAKDNISQLRDLEPGTLVVVQNLNKEDVVLMVEVKRTRFVAEYPDGRLVSVPARLFVRVHDGAGPAPKLSANPGLRRILSHIGTGRGQVDAADAVRDRGPAVLPELLEALTVLNARIENAPVGHSKGALGSALGPVRKVNPRDVKRFNALSGLFVEIATRMAETEVHSVLESCTEEKLRDQLLTALESS